MLSYMDYSKVLIKHYENLGWACNMTYDSIKWKDEIIPKPTKEELDVLLLDILKDEMREQRNQLLKDSDYTALPDFPAVNKQEWITYRQELRDFPTVWSVGVPFPTKPIS